MSQRMTFYSVLIYGLVLGGGAGFLGFVGPIILSPDSNQGPLLGIFITGPLGFFFGLFLGVIFGIIRKHKPGYRDPLYKWHSKS